MLHTNVVSTQVGGKTVPKGKGANKQATQGTSLSSRDKRIYKVTNISQMGTLESSPLNALSPPASLERERERKKDKQRRSKLPSLSPPLVVVLGRPRQLPPPPHPTKEGKITIKTKKKKEA